jgi:phenylacetyl-CoA:acceptor oxidoreductase
MRWWDKQLEEYRALPAWKDFPGVWDDALREQGGEPADFPFWMLTARSMQYAWGGNVGMQMIREVAQNIAGHRGVIVNGATARRLGIADGDEIELATPHRSTRGNAVIREGIRPDTLLAIGQFDHWVTPYAKDFGLASLNTLATMSLGLTDATGSGADVVRVSLRRIGGPRKERR